MTHLCVNCGRRIKRDENDIWVIAIDDPAVPLAECFKEGSSIWHEPVQ